MAQEDVKEEIRTKADTFGTPEKDAAGNEIKEVVSREGSEGKSEGSNEDNKES